MVLCQKRYLPALPGSPGGIVTSQPDPVSIWVHGAGQGRNPSCRRDGSNIRPMRAIVILAQGRRASPWIRGFSAKVASVMFGHWELRVTIDVGRGKPCPYGSLRADQCMVPIHLEPSLLLAVYPYLTPCASGVPLGDRRGGCASV